MNTLNNKIYIPEKYSLATLATTMSDAKDKGFSMILLAGKVYSIQAYFDAEESNEYFFTYYALFELKEIQEQPLKFNKSFEALYQIAMKMADEYIGQKTIEKRFSKLEEEYRELIQSFDAFMKFEQGVISGEYLEAIDDILGEMGDVLFVLLHIGHRLHPGTTAFTLLHGAISKMLSRMNDSDYVAKN